MSRSCRYRSQGGHFGFGGWDGAAGVLPEDEEVDSEPSGNCHRLGHGGGPAFAGAQVADLGVAASGCFGEVADADLLSVAVAFHELDQEISAHKNHGVLLWTHSFTSVDVVCVFVNKLDGTPA